MPPMTAPSPSVAPSRNFERSYAGPLVLLVLLLDGSGRRLDGLGLAPDLAGDLADPEEAEDDGEDDADHRRATC